MYNWEVWYLPEGNGLVGLESLIGLKGLYA
jgi:hypothetical protein